MNIILLGASGFIGTNLVVELAKNSDNKITVVDREKSFFYNIEALNLPNLNIVQSSLSMVSFQMVPYQIPLEYDQSNHQVFPS